MNDGCCQTQTGRLRTSQELEPGPVGATRTRINDNDQGVDMPAWMFKRSNEKTEKSEEERL